MDARDAADDVAEIPVLRQDPDPGQLHEVVAQEQALRPHDGPVAFRNESGRETDKAEGFADDTTGMTLFELESQSALKKILFIR
jgi:hypothetical protein